MPFPYSLSLFFDQPGMFIRVVDLDCGFSFIQGFDTALDGKFLIGFREWLILKLNYGNNLAWHELYLRYAESSGLGPQPRTATAKDQENAICVLGNVLKIFWNEREIDFGLNEIMSHHATWLHNQDWYQDRTKL